LSVNRGIALTIGLLAALAPTVARAQTNIDQGKSASQLFANGCAECHKSAGGLGKGKNTATVAEFLREHYTTGREQAAALAAYVVGGRDSVASPAAGRKPAATTAATAATEDTKPDRRHGQKPARPEESPSVTPSFMNPIVRTEPPHENRPATANRNRRNEPAVAAPTVEPAPAQEPAGVVHGPATAASVPPRPETPAADQEAAPAPSAAGTAPTAAAPTEAPAGETGESVPRDDIPD
jgi:hypothetical protein